MSLPDTADTARRCTLRRHAVPFLQVCRILDVPDHLGLDCLYVPPPPPRGPTSEQFAHLTALPTVILNSPAVSDPALGGANPRFGTGTDIAGIILFAIGLFWEAVGDIQKVSRSLVAKTEPD